MGAEGVCKDACKRKKMDDSTSSEEGETNDNTKNSVQNLYQPRFWIIRKKSGDVNENEKTDDSGKEKRDSGLKNLSPFAIDKSIKGLVGTVKNVKKLRNGTLLVETANNVQSINMQKVKSIANVPVIVEAHKQLNHCKGVISCFDLLNADIEEIKEDLQSQGVVDAVRLNSRKGGTITPTPAILLTFQLPALPQRVKAAYYSLKVRPFIPNPVRCFKCQKFGHMQSACTSQISICGKCGEAAHGTDECKKETSCTNCKGSHVVWSRNCPRLKEERKIMEVSVVEKISVAEARRKVKSLTRSDMLQSYSSVVARNVEQLRASQKITMVSVGTQTTEIDDSRPSSQKKPSQKNKSKSTTSVQADIKPHQQSQRTEKKPKEVFQASPLRNRKMPHFKPPTPAKSKMKTKGLKVSDFLKSGNITASQLADLVDMENDIPVNKGISLINDDDINNGMDVDANIGDLATNHRKNVKLKRSIYSCAVLTAIFVFLPSTRCQQIPPQIPPQRPPQIPPLNEPDFNNPRTSQPPTNYDPFNRGINQNQPDFNVRTQTPNYDPFNRGIPNQGGFQNQPNHNLPPNLQSTGNNYDSYSRGLQPWNQDHGFVIREATYFIVASRMVRPGQLYRVAVLVLRARLPLTVKSSISRNGVELTADVQDVKEGIPETLLMRVPTTSVPGTYKLRIEGTYDGSMGGLAFVNETIIKFSQRSMTIFVQTDKPVYIQGQTVRFRTIPINTELRAFNDAVDVYMLDPNRRIMRRWLSRQSNFGTVSLDYKLSDQPVFGEWTIQVTAQGQVEETQFLVEEYYQYRFEVNVTMPAFFFDTDQYIYGKVAANYTSGAPVRGNLTLKASVVPLRGGKPAFIPTYRQPEKYFNFDEKVPFWYPQRYNYWDPYTVPHLKFFNGVYEFRYPISELESFTQNNEGLEVRVTATVGERFLDEVIEGYSVARVYRSAIKVAFLGGSPQVFKPGMPFTVYLAVSYQDGSPLSPERLKYARMEVRSDIIMYGGGRRSINTQTLPMSSDNDGIWEMPIDLKYDLGLENNARARETLNTIQSMKISASFIDSMGDRANSELLLVAHFSPSNHQMKVSTSTRYARVGEYVIFHVRSNFFIEFFNFIVMSKGIILLTGREVMQSTIQTFAVTLSAEMAPVATIMVYHVGRYGDVVADSLTFPVNGISRNNFTVYINNRKARTGERVEVAIFGEPGAYVGLSGLDHAFYAMQADNQLTYDKVIYKMSTFDEDTNGTYMQRWFSREGNPDEMVSYPSSTYGIDANRTFEYAGLVVFSDIPVTRRPSEICNISLGFHECLNGRCYHQQQKCNGVPDCEDGADEAGCFPSNSTILKLFRKYRFNRIQRHYENVWLWKDINIGPHGRYIFDLPVPDRPAHWMVTAFSVSPTMGFGMIRKPIEYMGVLPFFMNVEMPTTSRQGEQVGIRCTVFNYMTNAIEATVVLADSRDYKFVHVEMNGIVRSYNPRTSFGEHQFFIYIRAQDAVTVHVPVVPTRLGDIHVTVQASTLIGKYSVTRKLHVEADGLPQYRHQSVLLDLSNRAYVFQYMHVNITETPIIPYDNDRYYVFGSNKATVSVVGDVVGAIFPTMPVNSTSLLELPMDCAEQNMFSLAVNIYTTMYMRLINQRNRTLEKEAFYHMNVLYQRQLSFMNPDGSFSLFRSDWNHSSPSVWLTSFCVQVFQEASFYEWENFLYIDPQVIAQAVSWLLRHQTAEGSFYEVTWFPDRKLNDSLLYPTFHDFGFGDYNYGARPSSRNISLTAHVLITLVSVKDLTGGLGSQVALAQAKAVRWLERNLKVLEDFGEPFDVAIVAYALLLSKASTAEQAFAILNRHARVEGGLKYWGKEAVPQPPYKIENQKPFTLPRLPYKYDATNIEATAYALLTYVARQELFTEQIVKWLNSQRLTDGGWASTQDTAIAMKALIEYTQRARLRDVSSLTVTVEAIALPGKKATMFVTNKNRAQLQRIEIPHAWGTVKVQANGAGYAILQMTVQYNVDIPKFQTKPPIRAFDLRTDARYHGRNQSHITYFVCQNWLLLNESLRSGMAVLDVTIPTGYIIQQQKLDSYILSRRVYNLRRARFQERKVLFYFDYLENRETCVNFTIERWYPVANMSRYLPIRVYDYYAPERFNETIFDTLSTYLLNICEVCGSSQCPYCPIYNIASKLPVPVITILISVLVVFIHRTRVWRI